MNWILLRDMKQCVNVSSRLEGSNTMKRSEIVLAGSGGQGLVTSGIMIAEAAILDGKNVVQTQSYGIAQRGGFSSAEVIISEDEILYQKVQNPDIIVVLNDDAANKLTNVTGHVLYDSSLMQDYSDRGWKGVPFYKIAQEAGSIKAANIVAIGAMIEMVSVISLESFIQVIQKRFKPEIAELNIRAIKKGMEAVKA